MRTITIIGAGQAGLCLAFGLRRDGHRVQLISNKTASQIEAGPVTSSQSMYITANSIEKSLGLNFWDDECPVFDEVAMAIADSSGAVATSFRAKMSVAGLAIDQRVKHSRWLRHFEEQGGNVRIEEATISSVERYAAESDLIVVATGKGELARLFKRDPERSFFQEPPHGLALTYIKRKPAPGNETLLDVTINPGVGGMVSFPGLTLSGPCDIFTFGSDVGGPMDHWDECKTPEDHLAFSQHCMDTYFPREAARFGKLELTDRMGVARARYTPEVRRPVATLPSGAKILGLGDVVTLCHPMGGQGANIATQQAMVLRDAIRERGDRPLDEAFMLETFERQWDVAQWGVRLSNVLASPIPPDGGPFFNAVANDPGLAQIIADSFDSPKSISPWFFDPALMIEFLVSRGHPPPAMPPPPPAERSPAPASL